MSAYIVADETINRVIDYVANHLKLDHTYLLDKLLDAAETSTADPDWQEKLGVSMALLNDRAQDARYGEGTAASDREGQNYTFQPAPCTPIQALKSLQCWHYQCSEGDVPATSDLYKVADELIGYIASSLISRTPEYERAEWA